MDRNQRIKLSADCFSEWGPVPAGIPQGTKLGPWLFLFMINNLVPPNSPGNAQIVIQVVEDWSKTHKMQLNAEKCKIMVINFKRSRHVFSPLTVDGSVLEMVMSAKVFGVSILNYRIYPCISRIRR